MLKLGSFDHRCQLLCNALGAGALALAAGVTGNIIAQHAHDLGGAVTAAAGAAASAAMAAMGRAGEILHWAAIPALEAFAIVTVGAAAGTYLLSRVRSRRQAAAAMRETERAGQYSTFAWHPARERVEWSQQPSFLQGELANQPFTAWAGILHPADRDATLRAVADLAIAPANYEVEFRVKNLDGSYRFLLLRATSFRERRGTATSVIGILIDLTEHCQAEELVRDAALELVVRDLAGSLADAINNSLAGLTNTIYLLQHDAQLQPALKQSLLEMAMAELSRLKQVSRNVLGIGEGRGGLHDDAYHASLPAALRHGARS